MGPLGCIDSEKRKASAEAEAFSFTVKLETGNSETFYFTFRKMIASVYSASDSISTNPRISAN